MNREQMKLTDEERDEIIDNCDTPNELISAAEDKVIDKCLSLLNGEEMGRETQNLYCKWCPQDCKGLTKDEKLGCLASGGFADELISLFIPLLNKKEEK